MHRLERQQLRMVWPEARLNSSVDPSIPAGYFIRTYQTGDDCAFMAIMALMDFDPWTPEKLEYNLSRILPEGWFFAVETKSNRMVATAMGLHSYSGHSPFTGDLGWLACHPDHQGCGLGYSLSACDQPVSRSRLFPNSTPHRIPSSLRDQDLLETRIRACHVLPRGL